MMILQTVRPTTEKISTMFTIVTNANLNTTASQAATYQTSR